DTWAATHGPETQGDGGPPDPERFTGICTLVNEPDNPAHQFCSEGVAPKPDGSRTRIDYLFVERPTDKHTFSLDISRLRRVPFKVEIGGEPSPSDPLGLHALLIASRKTHVLAQPHSP